MTVGGCAQPRGRDSAALGDHARSERSEGIVLAPGETETHACHDGELFAVLLPGPMLKEFRANAAAGTGDLDVNVPVLLAHTHADTTPSRRELDRVGQQIR
jgi:hypothetical protein